MTDAIRVLVVEDNEDHARLAREFLELTGPFAVEVAQDVQALWESLAARACDVILLDYNLPDGNGLDALAEVSARGYRVPVVMVTGRGDERVAVQAMQHGAVDYLVKTGDYLHVLPAVVQKAVRTHDLMLSAQRSLEQIRYQALLLENVQDAVVVWDLDGRLTFWNAAAEALFGWSAVERVGQSAASCYLTAFTPPIELPLPPGPALVNVERRGTRRTGEPVWISSTVTALHDTSGNLMGYMDVSRDITARKRLEAQVQAAQTQLVQSARLAAIGELASGVAHQISNPLTTIIGEAQLMLSELESDHPARESAVAIERAGWRAQEAVQRLLDFSRPASDTLEWLSVNDTLENALALVGGPVETAGITLRFERGEALPPVRGNARQMEDLWVNLLLIARDATADGGPHHITLRSGLTPEGAARVDVHDDGDPIPPERVTSIFEPAFNGPRHGRGSGLELSICREIVRQHHGQITVDSAEGRGTTFTVILPTEVNDEAH